MNRRNFIRRGALWVPTTFAILKSRGQAFTLRDPATVRKAESASGPTLKDSYQYQTVDYAHTLAQNYYYSAWRFSAAATFTLSSIRVWAEQFGTPTMTATPNIYSESGGSPGSLVTGGTGNNIALNTAPAAGSPGAWDLTGFSCSLSSGTDYWVVMYFNGGFSPTNTVKVWCKFVGSLGYWCKHSDSPPTWGNGEQNQKVGWQAYGT